MAEKSDEMMSREEKIQRAKEFFGRGSRNYLVKDYPEAAEDFSRACELYAELYGENADELGQPHLFYAKALIKLAQLGENKVLTLQDEEEEDDDDDEDGEEDGEEGENGEAPAEAQPAENGGPSEATAAESEEAAPAASSSNGTAADAEPQPGPSSGQTNGAGTNGSGASEVADIPEEEEDSTNLQFAWEALEIAVKIFERMGESGLPHLADAYFELAEISLENDHCAEAVKDYGERTAISRQSSAFS